MLGHNVEEDEENPDTMPENIMKAEHDAKKDKRCSNTMLEEDEENPDMMLEKIIKSRYDAREPETKGRDQIQERCWRTQNKTKGSNPSTVSENPN